MKRSLTFLACLFILALINGCTWFETPAANIKLPTLFSDHMVLQSDCPLPVWGTAAAGGIVTVEINNQRERTKVAADGKWSVRLAPMAAGGPYTLVIQGAETITYENVMIGEVWICSGQSNMEMPLRGWGKILNYEAEIAAAQYPDLRLFQVKHTISRTPLDTIACPGWKACTPATVADFSSVAYFFSRHLHRELNQAIGLIHTSWGGTVAEAWTSAEALKTMPYFVEKIAEIESTRTKTREEYQAVMADRNAKIAAGDEGMVDGQPRWHQALLDVSDWKTIKLPSTWERAGYPHLDGIMWFRKEISLPRSMANKELTLHLGPINDIDITWFNGSQIGSLSDANELRKYNVPALLVKEGKNSIAVRVQDIGNVGGLWGEPGQMFIESSSGQKISLAGAWLCKIGFDTQKLGPEPASPDNPNQPAVLFNAMLHPLIPYAIRGAIWYQGESNASRAFQYRTLFPLMIQDWRKNWSQGDFNFLFVQLANFMKPQTQPQEDSWAELREAQLMTLALANTGMACAIDIGDALDIHPKNKQEVGRRLALNALHLAYGKEIAYSGPIYRSMAVEGDKLRLSFAHINGGLKSKDQGPLQGFAIASADRKFLWAKAIIDGETVVVSHPNVPNPVAVRYAWASNPIGNLYNAADLPASPFRTDSWPGITQ